MDVNKIKILNTPGDKSITIPISENWDLLNRSDTISIEENRIVDGVIGKPLNYELARYSMKSIGTSSKLYHYFNFLTSSNTWTTSYPPTFERSEIEYLAKSFFKSFFKLDFYDSMDQLAQKIYFTIILPASSGILGDEIGIELTIPIFELDHVGTQEGYYIYWYEDESLFNISEMYFKAKFFNGKNGEFSQFSNEPQNLIFPNSINNNYLYFKVVFDYNNFEYTIKDLNDNITNILNWYQIV